MLPRKAETILPCAYCGYTIGRGEWDVPVGKLHYHLECAEAHSNIVVDWDTFNRLLDMGEI